MTAECGFRLRREVFAHDVASKDLSGVLRPMRINLATRVHDESVGWLDVQRLDGIEVIINAFELAADHEALKIKRDNESCRIMRPGGNRREPAVGLGELRCDCCACDREHMLNNLFCHSEALACCRKLGHFFGQHHQFSTIFSYKTTEEREDI